MKSSPEQIEVLRELVAQIAQHQRNESDSKFCARYRRFLGSTKTWRSRLLAGDFVQVDVPKKIEALSRLVSYLEGGSIPEEYYDDLPFCSSFAKLLTRLENQTVTDRRILCVLGAVGVGKTMACNAAVRETISKSWNGHRRLHIIVPEALRENKLGLLNAIATALGCVPDQSGAAALMDAVKVALSGKDTLIFDEAHQGGVMLMRLIKDLTNVTKDAKFVYVALRTEYMRVLSANKGAITEAKQFIRRCMQPVFDMYADGTKAAVVTKEPIDPKEPKAGNKTAPGDAALLLHHKAGLSLPESRRLAAEKLNSLRQHGNLSSLADAIENAEAEAEKEDLPITPELLSDAISAVCP
jgi:hypothetical protein